MSTTYPAAKQTFVDPTSANNLNDALVKHSELHTKINHTLVALQDKIGYETGAVTTIIARIAAKMDKINGIQAGDILVGNSSGGLDRVVKPAANHVWGTTAAGAIGYKPDPIGGGGSFDPLTWSGWNTKGQMLVCDADNAGILKSVGANGTVPIADSSQPGGWRWGTQAPAAGTGDLGWARVGGFTRSAVTTAIAAAGDYGVVYFPAGTYPMPNDVNGNPVPIVPREGQKWVLDPLAKITAPRTAIKVENSYCTIDGGIVKGESVSAGWDGLIDITGDHNKIRNVTSTHGDINFKISAGHHNTIEHCYSSNDTRSGIWVTNVNGSPSRDVKILFNYVLSEGASSGIHVRGGQNEGYTASTAWSYRPIIQGNHVERPTTDLSPANNCLGIETWGLAPYGVIIGNRLLRCRYAISVDKSDYTTVQGNVIEDTQIGIELAGSEFCTVVGNVVNCLPNSYSGSKGVSCSNSANATNIIANNILRNFTASGIHINGSEGNLAPRYIISGNQLYTNSSCECINLQHADYAIVTNNLFWGNGATDSSTGSTSARCDGIIFDIYLPTATNHHSYVIANNIAYDIDQFIKLQWGTDGDADTPPSVNPTSTTPRIDRLSLTGNVFTNVGSVFARPGSDGKVSGVYIGSDCKSIGNIGYPDYKHIRAGTLY